MWTHPDHLLQGSRIGVCPKLQFCPIALGIISLHPVYFDNLNTEWRQEAMYHPTAICWASKEGHEDAVKELLLAGTWPHICLHNPRLKHQSPTSFLYWYKVKCGKKCCIGAMHGVKGWFGVCQDNQALRHVSLGRHIFNLGLNRGVSCLSHEAM